MHRSINFKNDTISANTKVIPVVLIEKQVGVDEWKYYAFSTEPVTLKLKMSEQNGDYSHISCYPYLLSNPKIRESIDIKSHSYKTSNVKLKLSDLDLTGSPEIKQKFQIWMLLFILNPKQQTQSHQIIWG